MSEVYCPGQSNGIISHINSIKYFDRSSEYGVSPRPLPESTRVTGVFCTLMRISLVVLRVLLSLGRGQIKSSFFIHPSLFLDYKH